MKKRKSKTVTSHCGYGLDVNGKCWSDCYFINTRGQKEPACGEWNEKGHKITGYNLKERV